MNKPLKVFITYSHKNTTEKDELITRLALLKCEGVISIWHDNEILPGDKWRDAIFSNLADSDLLLYLTSAYSLESENCNTKILQHFGTGTEQRDLLGKRLERIYMLAHSTGQVARFIVYGSFVTTKSEPGDVDIFLVMEDSFDVDQVHGETAIIFDHQKAHNVLEASIFWIRKMAAIGGEQEAIEDWQTKRDETLRGIVEVIHNDSEQSRT